MKEEPEHFSPKDKKHWREWLQKHHKSKNAIWLVMHKKGTATHNLTWNEAVEEALCFGWIDSVKRTVDEVKFKQYFGKRKPTSTWSKINKEKIVELTSAGLMTKAGLKCIEVAKENGSWTILDSAEKLEIPDDLEKAFIQHQGAREYFEQQNKSTRKGMLHWIAMARRAETRQKRVQEIVENAALHKKPRHFER